MYELRTDTGNLDLYKDGVFQNTVAFTGWADSEGGIIDDWGAVTMTQPKSSSKEYSMGDLNSMVDLFDRVKKL